MGLLNVSVPTKGIGSKSLEELSGKAPHKSMTMEEGEEEKEESHKALLVGINYVGSQHALKGCWNDANNMGNVLKEHFDVTSSHIAVRAMLIPRCSLFLDSV